MITEQISLKQIRGTKTESALLTFFENSNDPSLLGYHHPAYLGLLEELLGCECAYILCHSGEVIQGLIPLAIASGPYGKVVNSMPFFGANGSFATLNLQDFSTRQELRKGLEAFIESTNPASAVIYTPFQSELGENFFGSWSVDFRFQKFTQFASLSSPVHWPAKKAADIKRAVQFGFEVRPSRLSDLDPIWKFYSESCATIGIPVKPKAFLEKSLRIFEKSDPFHCPFQWLTAEKDGVVAGGLMCMKGPRTLSYTLPVADPSLRQYQSNALLIDLMVRQHLPTGVRFFNFESSPLRDDPVYLYKKRWGAEEARYEILGIIRSPELRNASEEDIRKHYPYFFVKPFERITGTK